MLTVCVSLVFGGEYVLFRIICSLLCSIVVDRFDVDPHSIQYENRLAKPTNVEEMKYYSVLCQAFAGSGDQIYGGKGTKSLCSINVDTFQVVPHSIQYGKRTIEATTK